MTIQTNRTKSGYCYCACRDCFDIAIGNDGEPTLCCDCEEAGCDPSGECECGRSDAYGMDEDEQDEGAKQ